MAAASPGRDAPLPDDQDVKITHLTVGIWRRRATRGSLYLLVLHSRDKFVLLSEDSFYGSQAQPRRLFSLPSQLHARSPFRTTSGTAGKFRVVALELDWKDICGLNYHNPLCNDGRVVIEAAKLTKRQFSTMQEAQKFYLRQAHTPVTASPQHVNKRAGILRTYASSPDMMQPLGTRGSLSVVNKKVHQQQQQWQQLSGQQVQQQSQHSQQVHALCHSNSAGQYVQRSLADNYSCAPQQPPATPFALAEPIAEEPSITGADASTQHSETHQPCLRHAGIGTTSPPQARYTDPASPCADADTVPAREQSHGQSHGQSHDTSTASAADLAGSHHHQHCHFADDTVQQPVRSLVSEQHQGSTAQCAAAQPQQQARSSMELGSDKVQGGSAEWPDVTSWTLPCHEFGYRTVTFSFVDPNLPEVLRPAINDNERLLKLYESGLPVWAIFLPTYGLYYRPWMRRMTWTIFIAVSVFSMACGFYDLYKNVPHLDKVLRRVLSAMCLPSTTIFQWLENHAQIRLSILLTYLFGESIFVVHLLQWLGRAWNAVGQPMLRVVGPPLTAIGAFVGQWGSQAMLWARSCGLATHAILKTLFGPPMLHLLHILRLVGHTLLPLWLAVVWVVTGPVKVCIAAGQSMGAASRGVWQGAQPLRQAASSAAGLVRTASMAAPATQSSAQNLSQQVQWWWAWMPSDAWELMRSSALKVMRALQTLGKLTAQLGSDINKHRGSLSRRLWRFWRRCKARLKRFLSAMIAWPATLYQIFSRCMAACWRCHRMQVAPEASEERKSFSASFDDRPILNGIVADRTHSHAD